MLHEVVIPALFPGFNGEADGRAPAGRWNILKSVLVAFWISALFFRASAAEIPRTPSNTPTPRPSSIISVTTAADNRTLVVRYTMAGEGFEEHITFAQEIVDFRYARWMGDSGIAVVARIGAAKSAEYFYSAFYLSGGSIHHPPVKIPAPSEAMPLLEIGNTVGDSVVITAIQHTRDPSDGISGWVYIDNCPLTDRGLATGRVTPFTIPIEGLPPK